MKRHNGRIIAVLALYSMDINKFNEEESLESLNHILEMEAEEEYPVEIDVEYATTLVKGVMDNLIEIDNLIINSLTNYTLDRLSYVDRAIIRIAVYEMNSLKLAKTIAINEAIEITKDYSSIDNDKQVNFNNRLLDNIAKGL